MWIEGVAVFLAVSLVLYMLLAGADFGAGIIEFLVGVRNRRAHQDVIYHALGPVWEANHIWLILVVVILFSGFPLVFSLLCTRFHIPLTLVLLGIVLRGCAFTFRHYDVKVDASHRYYTWFFEVGSMMAPFFLGTVAGGLYWVEPELPPDFFRAYIGPWLNLFSVSLGLFTCCNCVLLAAVYLIGETAEEELRRTYQRYARVALAATVAAGGLVFAVGATFRIPLFHIFVRDWHSLGAGALATVIAAVLWFRLERLPSMVARLLVATLVGCVLAGWFGAQYPVLLGTSVTLHNAAAPESTLRALFYCLVAGSCFIFPPLFYLLKIFKVGRASQPERSPSQLTERH